MPTTVPASTPSDGYFRLWWVTTIADVTAPKVATEILAASSLDLTCYLKEPWGASTTVETVEDWRACLRTVLASPGTSKTDLQDLIVTHKVQVPADVANKAYAALAPGTQGYLVARYGIDVDTAPAAAQIVDVFPVTVATRDKLPIERNSQLKAKVTVMLRDVAQYDKAAAA
jgi:hypothetical protein